jgi:hypothetical protein
MKNIKAPIIDKALLDYLDSIYPDRMPAPNLPHDEYIRRASEVSVVRHLKMIHHEQQEDLIKERMKS